LSEIATSSDLIEFLGVLVSVSEDEITVDDGTGVVVIQLDGHKVYGRVGQLVQCLVECSYSPCEGTHSAMEKSNQGMKLIANIILWDVSNERETLFQWQLLVPPGPFGIPHLSFTAHDLLIVIQCAGDTGASIEDLSIVLDRPVCELQPMIIELQSEGAIYQTRQGTYTPL
jgi:hypothetical protein